MILLLFCVQDIWILGYEVELRLLSMLQGCLCWKWLQIMCNLHFRIPLIPFIGIRCYRPIWILFLIFFRLFTAYFSHLHLLWGNKLILSAERVQLVLCTLCCSFWDSIICQDLCSDLCISYLDGVTIVGSSADMSHDLTEVGEAEGIRLVPNPYKCEIITQDHTTLGKILLSFPIWLTLHMPLSWVSSRWDHMYLRSC